MESDYDDQNILNEREVKHFPEKRGLNQAGKKPSTNSPEL